MTETETETEIEVEIETPNLEPELCLSCIRGFQGLECHHEPEPLNTSGIFSGETKQKPENRLGGYKDAKDLKDPLSTGRKEAAKLFPLNEDLPCEWQGLANCGGGKYPIIGCVDGKQLNRHHGPDKTTTNNQIGNVHRICPNCHNRWHAANDKDYHPEFGHAPRKATNEELKAANK